MFGPSGLSAAGAAGLVDGDQVEDVELIGDRVHPAGSWHSFPVLLPVDAAAHDPPPH